MAGRGRNDACHCGSGKKYKKCCLPADEAAERNNARPPLRDEEIIADAFERLGDLIAEGPLSSLRFDQELLIAEIDRRFPKDGGMERALDVDSEALRLACLVNLATPAFFRLAKQEIAKAFRVARGAERSALALAVEMVESALAGGFARNENPLADVVLQVQLAEILDDHREAQVEERLEQLERWVEDHVPIEATAEWLKTAAPLRVEPVEQLREIAQDGVRSLVEVVPPAFFRLDEWLLLQAAVLPSIGMSGEEAAPANLTLLMDSASARINAIAGQEFVRRIADRAIEDGDEELRACAVAFFRSPAMVTLATILAADEVCIWWRSDREKHAARKLSGEDLKRQGLEAYADFLGSTGELVAEANVRRAQEIFRELDRAEDVRKGGERDARSERTGIVAGGGERDGGHARR